MEWHGGTIGHGVTETPSGTSNINERSNISHQISNLSKIILRTWFLVFLYLVIAFFHFNNLLLHYNVQLPLTDSSFPVANFEPKYLIVFVALKISPIPSRSPLRWPFAKWPSPIHAPAALGRSPLEGQRHKLFRVADEDLCSVSCSDLTDWRRTCRDRRISGYYRTEVFLATNSTYLSSDVLFVRGEIYLYSVSAALTCGCTKNGQQVHMELFVETA